MIYVKMYFNIVK